MTNLSFEHNSRFICCIQDYYMFNMNISGFVFTKSQPSYDRYDYSTKEFFLNYYYSKMKELSVTKTEWL
jgi:hypothetical protein